MKILFIIASFIVFLMPGEGRAQNTRLNCERQLINKVSPQTLSLLGYIEELYFSHTINEENLKNFLAALNSGKLQNPIPLQDAKTSPTKLIHHDLLEEWINETYFEEDLLFIQEKLLNQLSEKQGLLKKREIIEEETMYVARPMNFHPIPVGSYQIEITEKGKKSKPWITIATPFEMMSTLVTQYHWAFVLNTTPSTNRKGEDSVMWKSSLGKFPFKPDYPVESVSWYAVQNFINALNRWSQFDEPELYRLIPDHTKGDMYRLPTQAEWQYVASELNTRNKYINIQDQAWYQSTAHGKTHAVALLKPTIIDGYSFYDLHGNVHELMADFVQEHRPVGIDPIGCAAKDFMPSPTAPGSARRIEPSYAVASRRVLKGGCFDSFWGDLFPHSYGDMYSKDVEGLPTVGFRLVREKNKL